MKYWSILKQRLPDALDPVRNGFVELAESYTGCALLALRSGLEFESRFRQP
jgi:hypothetical protein